LAQIVTTSTQFVTTLAQIATTSAQIVTTLAQIATISALIVTTFPHHITSIDKLDPKLGGKSLARQEIPAMMKGIENR